MPCPHAQICPYMPYTIFEAGSLSFKNNIRFMGCYFTTIQRNSVSEGLELLTHPVTLILSHRFTAFILNPFPNSAEKIIFTSSWKRKRVADVPLPSMRQTMQQFLTKEIPLHTRNCQLFFTRTDSRICLKGRKNSLPEFFGNGIRYALRAQMTAPTGRPADQHKTKPETQ